MDYIAVINRLKWNVLDAKVVRGMGDGSDHCIENRDEGGTGVSW